MKKGAPKIRVFQRAMLDAEVMIHDEDNLYLAPLNNLSAGGCFVDELMSLPKGKAVRIVIRSERLGGVIQARGTVVRVETGLRHGTAVEFTSIGALAREKIQTLVFETKMETALKAA